MNIADIIRANSTAMAFLAGEADGISIHKVHLDGRHFVGVIDGDAGWLVPMKDATQAGMHFWGIRQLAYDVSESVMEAA